MSHTKGEVVLDHSIRTAINMAAPPYQHIAMVNITQNKNYTITKEEHDDNARRIAALWNMAERLGMSTEEIESGNVETKLKAAPDMLEALEGAKWAMESDICAQLLKKMDVYQDVVKAIRKARGEVRWNSQK